LRLWGEVRPELHSWAQEVGRPMQVAARREGEPHLDATPVDVEVLLAAYATSRAANGRRGNTWTWPRSMRSKPQPKEPSP